MSLFGRRSRWGRPILLAALLAASFPAHAQDGEPSDKNKSSEKDKGGDKSDDKDKSEDKSKAADAGDEKKSNLVGRASSELSFYSDSEAVTVVTPTIAASLENPLSEWSIGARYLVDAVSAASADIVATASRRWREVRHGGSMDGAVKAGPVHLGASGSFSIEPDFVGWSVGGTVSVDLFEKNATLLLGYAFGHDVAGRSGTPFSVFSHTILGHSINGAFTLLVNRDTIMAFVGDAIIENGDSSKPYRYIPMFSADVAPTVPVGASIDQVNQLRLQERPLEQLPLSRYRFAATGRIAHRFTSSTLRVSERLYRDTWGLTASTTDIRYIADVHPRISLWPHARLHFQTPVSFWQRAYVASYTPGGQWTIPALRTGDRELGPLRGLTGGGGIQIRIGPDSSPADVTLSLSGEAVWTAYLDDLYVSNRASGLGALTLEAVFE